MEKLRGSLLLKSGPYSNRNVGVPLSFKTFPSIEGTINRREDSRLPTIMKTSLFDYHLPSSLVAQQPAEPRDGSRLFVYHRDKDRVEHRTFRDIVEYFKPGDVLVANDSRVIRARLFGKKPTGGKVEILLLAALDAEGLRWNCLVKGRNLPVGSVINIDACNGERICATLEASNESGMRTLLFSKPVNDLGEIPLPPYITEYTGDRERYQTVYSRSEGSAAAPTAGLHFTPELLSELHNRGVELTTVTLHVGLDTFKPVSAERIEDHIIHTEWASLNVHAAGVVNEATLSGGRVVAVGTTSVRTLEFAAAASPSQTNRRASPRVSAFQGDVDLFIRPGHQFRATDALITNFHLPKSSLLMLVSAFVGQHADDADWGRRRLMSLYQEAIREKYRFYSFGDAMLIL